MHSKKLLFVLVDEEFLFENKFVESVIVTKQVNKLRKAN